MKTPFFVFSTFSSSLFDSTAPEYAGKSPGTKLCVDLSLVIDDDVTTGDVMFFRGCHHDNSTVIFVVGDLISPVTKPVSHLDDTNFETEIKIFSHSSGYV